MHCFSLRTCFHPWPAYGGTHLYTSRGSWWGRQKDKSGDKIRSNLPIKVGIFNLETCWTNLIIKHNSTSHILGTSQQDGFHHLLSNIKALWDISTQHQYSIVANFVRYFSQTSLSHGCRIHEIYQPNINISRLQILRYISASISSFIIASALHLHAVLTTSL